MKIKSLEKQVKEKLKQILIDYYYCNNNCFVLFSDERDNRFYYEVKSIGRDVYLNITISICLNKIENKWFCHKNLLGLDQYYPITFYNTFNQVNRSRFPTIEPFGIPIEDEDDWVVDIIDTIVKEYYLKFNEQIQSLSFCDKLINEEIKITDKTLRISPIDGLPFRKVLIAEEAKNPKLEEIKKAMYKYCEEQYELGKKENFEKLCKIKPVFETLFGKY